MAFINDSSKKTASKKNYAQYYTAPVLGVALIELLPKNIEILRVVDFSAGEGALLYECKRKFPDCKLYGFDIDPENVEILKKSNITASQVDATSKNIKFTADDNGFCLSVGNPPFKKIEKNEHITSLFDNYDIDVTEKVRAENYFLLYSLHIVKENGFVAFVIPEGIISGDKNEKFRSMLIKKFNVLEVMEIPSKIFSGTEAKTFIIIIEKSEPTVDVVISYFGKKQKKLIISNEDFIKRADYKFYYNRKKNQFKPSVMFDSLRGDIMGRIAKKDPEKIIHTTSFKNGSNEFSNNLPYIYSDNKIVGMPGDIIIPRVGSRSLGKVGVISEGHFLLSDCVILLRPTSDNNRIKILRFLNSEPGRLFVNSISKGVGASYITLKDINLMPQYI